MPYIRIVSDYMPHLRKSKLKQQIVTRTARTGAEEHRVVEIKNDIKEVEMLIKELKKKPGLISALKSKTAALPPRVLSISELEKKISMLRSKIKEDDISKEQATIKLKKIKNQARKIVDS